MKVWQNERAPEGGGGGDLADPTWATCTKTLQICCSSAHRVKRWIPTQLWVINTARIRRIDLSGGAHVPQATAGFARLLQPHCDDSIDGDIIEKHTTAIYGENPGNGHPNPNNSVSAWQLMALLATADWEGDGSFQHMKSKSSNCTVRPVLLQKVTSSGTLECEKNPHQSVGNGREVHWNEATNLARIIVALAKKNSLFNSVLWMIFNQNYPPGLKPRLYPEQHWTSPTAV